MAADVHAMHRAPQEPDVPCAFPRAARPTRCPPQARHGDIPPTHLLNRTTLTLLWLHRVSLVMGSIWTLVEIGVRCRPRTRRAAHLGVPTASAGAVGEVHTLLECACVPCRLTSPLALRAFLMWLQDYNAGLNPPVWRGWMLAVALGAGGFGMTLTHHRLFW